MTRVSTGIECTLLHENNPLCQRNLIASPAQTPFETKVYMASIWRQKTNLFQVGEARELCFNYSPKRRRL